ncbi:hypothetical protein [Streptomyces sp. NPDC086023]|uniref:hypothetical protein n=1 Tax=Streptomyces sp. NPDC086023 TaxID=3365746 RepID=UPI0037D46F7E
MKRIFRMAMLATVATCAASLAAGQASATGLGDPLPYTPAPAGSVVFNNGNHNVNVFGNDNNTAGRDNLSGSNHVAGSGHAVGLGVTPPPMQTCTQITVVNDDAQDALMLTGQLSSGTITVSFGSNDQTLLSAGGGRTSGTACAPGLAGPFLSAGWAYPNTGIATTGFSSALGPQIFQSNTCVTNDAVVGNTITFHVKRAC